MTAYFKKLFSVELQHNYYADNLTSDLTIEVENSCMTLLRNSRLVNRILPGKVVVYYEARDAAGTPRVPINQYIPFTFYLRLRNNAFMQRTQLPAYGQNTFYFSNFDLDGNERLPAAGTTTVVLHDTPDYTQAIPEGVDFNVPAASTSTVNVARFLPGQGFTDPRPVVVRAGFARGRFPQPGLFQFTGTSPLMRSLRYAEAALKTDKPFAIIQIWKGADTDYQTPLQYAINWEQP